ncbi:hypothetical protein GQ600_26527 [Phytophthora cactorum]|nr:hypothetical protein GQ600_26527 [Phytophthora cactorum]
MHLAPAELPPPLETEALVQQNLSTRSELEAWERELNASQVEIEVLQVEKSQREPVVKKLFERTVEEDAKLKQLLEDCRSSARRRSSSCRS